jgi:phage gp46-like protein
MDITTVWRTTHGDWCMSGPGLLAGDDLQTCVAIMLFTDRVADPDDVITDGTGDPRGWWGDAYRTRPIGSKLWLYERAKQIAPTLLSVQSAAQTALQPLIDDGVAASVSVAVSWNGPGFLLLQTGIQRPGAAQPSAYSWAWDMQRSA